MVERLYIPCRKNEQEACPEWPDCREDKHHLFSRRLGKEAILAAETAEDKTTIKRFIENPANHVRSCRDIHKRVLDRLPIPLPPIDYMRDFNANSNGDEPSV